jgi:hypothetical protein
MKKIICVLLLICICFSFVSCGGTEIITEYVEVEKIVEVPIETVVEKEVVVEVEKIIEVPVEIIIEKEVVKETLKEVEIEKPVCFICLLPFEYCDCSPSIVYQPTVEAKVYGALCDKIGDNLYRYVIDARDYNAKEVGYLFDTIGVYPYDYSGIKQFKTGEFISKPGIVIQNISYVGGTTIWAPKVFDSDYNLLNVEHQYTNTILNTKFEINNINKEEVIIRVQNSVNSASVFNYYGAEKIIIEFSLREGVEVESLPETIGYAGLQVYVNGTQTTFYVSGKLGELISISDIETQLLQAYPGYSVYARNYAISTKLYFSDTKFTTYKVYLIK